MWVSKKEIETLSGIVKGYENGEMTDIRDNKEGAFSILKDDIYSLVELQKEQLDRASEQRDILAEYMSDISHQFKTPLTAISLMTELLMEPGVSEEQRLEYAGKIDSQINKMTWLIRNLLTLSQLEAGVLEMKQEPVVLKEMTDDISDSLSVLAEVAEVELECRVPDTIKIKADKHWLREAVSNIIKNCIEHTAAGGYVKVSASQNNIYTSLIIEDNGKGIDKDHLSHIFERFYKAGNSSPNSVGIGLAMAKQIINSHGGRIEVESEVGKGSKFIITLYV